MYRLKFIAYCGVPTYDETFEQEIDARNAARDIIMDRRFDGYTVTTVTKNEEWEVLEPEDSAMVPDDCGTLRLRHITFECRECGSRHETLGEAEECCQEEYARDMYA